MSPDRLKLLIVLVLLVAGVGLGAWLVPDFRDALFAAGLVAAAIMLIWNWVTG